MLPFNNVGLGHFEESLTTLKMLDEAASNAGFELIQRLSVAIYASKLFQMPRPTILVAEPEPSQALSVRKLVLETAKFNVLTAHSTREALDLFKLFPNISLAVLVPDERVDCDSVATGIKNATTKIPVIFLHSAIGAICRGADHALLSGEPEELLMLIRSLLGDPRKSA
jgi:CheY-like chemotaxis protein